MYYLFNIKQFLALLESYYYFSHLMRFHHKHNMTKGPERVNFRPSFVKPHLLILTFTPAFSDTVVLVIFK